MKLPELNFVSKCKIVTKTLFIQILFFVSILFLFWAGNKLYSKIDQTEFPEPMKIQETSSLSELDKGKLVADSIIHQMKYELNSMFGWSINDILFNSYFLDNRASRQYGVYSMNIAKLGSNDKENQFLYSARLNQFAIDPRSFIFPSAESSYEKGIELVEKYKKSLDDGSGVYNCRTDDLYASFNVVVGENLLGYALGLLQNTQELAFYELDNKIYEVQGIVLVVRDFINTIYSLYPEINNKGNIENMTAAMDYMNRICTYDPLYITAKVNSGELIISYVLFAKNRLEDVRDSIRM